MIQAVLGSIVQALADGSGQIPGMEWLGKEVRASLEPDVGAEEFGAVTAGKDHFEAGSFGAQFFGQFPAGHALGHHHVGQQKSGFGERAAPNAQCFFAVRGLEHLIAEVSQHGRDQLAQRGLVFHHQDRLVAAGDFG